MALGVFGFTVNAAAVARWSWPQRLAAVNRGGIQTPVARGGIQTPVRRGGIQSPVAWRGGPVAVSRTGGPGRAPFPRLGPRGVDPAHHNANIMVRDASGRLRHHERIVSGNMTPEEKGLGFPRGSLASHTEARAIRNIPLRRGETMIITGQYPPCKPCKGVMNQTAREAGATIIYRWRENGVTRTWTAGN
ncbi:MAG: hypothetical protein KatS3mg105_4669 [Gemmatales bacterium]|nr:MAG: hypothetical protein KatS3mg105_4669 [Gemmatales bacterium]